MIEYILPYIKDMEARALPPYQTFIRNEARFIKDRYDRIYKSMGHETNGVKLLRYILQFTDQEYLDKQCNNYDRYLYHLRYVHKNLTTIFDRVERGRGYRNMFLFHDSNPTEEFIFPIEDVNTITNLPMYSDNWNDWRKVRCIRLWDHNSSEFTTKLLNDRLNFSTDIPSNAVILIDVVALIMKYYIWLHTQRENEIAKELAELTPQQLFIHKYVLSDLIWDNSYIWLINQINKMLVTPEEEIKDTFSAENLRYDQQWGWVAMNSREGFESLYRLVNDTRRNIRPESILSSKLLFGNTIHDRMILSYETLTLPGQKQYDYLRWMRDRKLLTLVINLFKTRPELPVTRVMNVNLRRHFKRVIVGRPWNVCNSISLRKEIETEINEFYSLLESY